MFRKFFDAIMTRLDQHQQSHSANMAQLAALNAALRDFRAEVHNDIAELHQRISFNNRPRP